MRAILDFMAKFVASPIKNGFVGYLTFFFVLAATKYFSYLIGNQQQFKIEEGDALLSLVGFALFFLIRLLENLKEPESRSL